MTLGVGYAERDLWGAQQALNDRGLASALSGTFGGDLTLSVSRGDVLTEIQNTDQYLRTQDGIPWPTPTPGYQIEPTVESYPSNINKGWNAAAQPGSPPGLNGCSSCGPQGSRDIAFGGMSYEEAMNYSPAPLTEQLGALRGGSATPYQEPARELQPGFGGGGWHGPDYLAMGLIAAGGYAGFRLSRDRETAVRAGATVGGLLAGLAAAAISSFMLD